MGTGSYAKDGSTATDPAKSDFKPGFSGGLGKLNESAQSVSTGGISAIAGDVQARSGATPSGLINTFDASQAQANLNAQVAITQAFSSAAPKAVADFAQSRIKLAQRVGRLRGAWCSRGRTGHPLE